MNSYENFHDAEQLWHSPEGYYARKAWNAAIKAAITVIENTPHLPAHLVKNLEELKS